MNRDYNATGIRWNLKGISRIENKEWFVNVAPDRCVYFRDTFLVETKPIFSKGEVDMKGLYRKGSKKDLNVYTVGQVPFCITF